MRKIIEFKEEIGIFRDVFPTGFCQHIISEFNRIQDTSSGLIIKRRQSDGAVRHHKDDKTMFANFLQQEIDGFIVESSEVEGESLKRDTNGTFFRGVEACVNTYIEKYSVLMDYRLRCTAMKVQRTDPGGGYHVWHSERGNPDLACRELVYMLYLNTLPDGEGGETEFLYKKLRIQPEENTMLIWPASFTHAHRGNTVLGNTPKYIITGWFLIE